MKPEKLVYTLVLLGLAFLVILSIAYYTEPYRSYRAGMAMRGVEVTYFELFKMWFRQNAPFFKVAGAVVLALSIFILLHGKRR